MQLPASFEVDFKNMYPKNNNNSNDDISKKMKEQHYGSKYNLIFDYDQKNISAKWTSKSLKKKNLHIPEHILDSIFEKYANYNNGIIGRRIKVLPCFTEYQIAIKDENNNHDVALFRACPSFRDTGKWYDWAIINWGDEEGLLEGRILAFIDIHRAEYEPFDVPAGFGTNVTHNIIKEKKVALIHSTIAGTEKFERKPKRNEQNEFGTVVNRLCHFKEMETTYQIISIDNIVQPCCVIPDKTMKEQNKLHELGVVSNVIVMTNPKKWHLKFVDYESKLLQEEASQKSNNRFPIGHPKHIFEG